MRHRFFKQCFVTATVGLNSVSQGCTIGVTATLIPQLQQEATVHLTDEYYSWLGSATPITLLIGNFMMPPIMGRWGRKVAHFTSLIVALLGWVVVITAATPELMIVGRALHGISYGMILPLRSVLIGEYTSPRLRGPFLMAISFTEGFGILFVHLVGSILSWQMASLVCIVFPTISLLMNTLIPESPSWLASKGRHDDCRNVFRWLRGDHEDAELEDMIEAALISKETTSNEFKTVDILNNAWKVFKKKEFYKPVVLMIHFYWLSEFSGATLVSGYSVGVISLITEGKADPYFWMLFIDIQRNLSNGLSIYTTKIFRRRTLLVVTGGLCVTSIAAMILYGLFRSKGILPYPIVWVPLLILNIQMFSVSTGTTTLPYIVAGEVFPLNYRGTAGSISVIAISIGYFSVSYSYPMLSGLIGIYWIYFVYGIMTLYTFLVICYMMPETSGKTLQEIEEEFKGTTRT